MELEENLLKERFNESSSKKKNGINGWYVAAGAAGILAFSGLVATVARAVKSSEQREEMFVEELR